MGLPSHPFFTEAPPGLTVPAHHTLPSSDAEGETSSEQDFIGDTDGSNDQNESTDKETEAGAPGYEGAIFTFEDGSRWKLTQALSPIKYQQGSPPFEARQVFNGLCVDASKGEFQEGQEAVIKVKYQIKGPIDSVVYFWKYADNCAKRVALFSKKPSAKKRSPEAYEEALSDSKYAEYLYKLAIRPAPSQSLNKNTLDEANVLLHLKNADCKHAPHLLEVASDCLLELVDDQAMPGGYAVFMLMTKVPGEALDWKNFWSMDEDARQDVRFAFKDAVLDLMRCGIKPHDRNLSNIIWDRKERRCYIVDFEEYDIVHEDKEPEAIWTDDCYRWWRIAEECKPTHIDGN